MKGGRMAGEYRTKEVLEKLPHDMAKLIQEGGLRIALSSQPMSGVVKRPDLAVRMAEEYGKIEGTRKYATGLRDGSMVPVVDVSANRAWAPGELFFKS
jgi:hypothetical protein